MLLLQDFFHTKNFHKKNYYCSPELPLSPVTVNPPDSPRGPTQAEIMRQQRNQEAKELIGSRVGTAKAIFSQNSASGQMHNKSTSNAPTKPVRNSIAQKINNFNNPQPEAEPITEPKVEPIFVPVVAPVVTPVIEPVKSEIITTPVPATNGNKTNEIQPQPQSQQQHHNYDDDEDGDQYSTIKRSPHTKTTSQAATPVDENVTLDTRIPEVEDPTHLMDPKWDDSPDMMVSDTGLRARALYDYQAGMYFYNTFCKIKHNE